MDKNGAQKMFKECGIDEDIQCVTRYINNKLETRFDIITDRVCYDVDQAVIASFHNKGTEDLKKYILESCI